MGPLPHRRRARTSCFECSSSRPAARRCFHPHAVAGEVEPGGSIEGPEVWRPSPPPAFRPHRPHRQAGAAATPRCSTYRGARAPARCDDGGVSDTRRPPTCSRRCSSRVAAALFHRLSRLQWGATGERLTEEISDAIAARGLAVLHMIPEEAVRAALCPRACSSAARRAADKRGGILAGSELTREYSAATSVSRRSWI